MQTRDDVIDIAMSRFERRPAEEGALLGILLAFFRTLRRASAQ